MKIADDRDLDRVLVIGSTLRKEHPLIAHRLRQATKKGLQLSVLNPVDDDLLMRGRAQGDRSACSDGKRARPDRERGGGGRR